MSDVNMLKKKKKLGKCKFCGDWHNFEKGSCPALGKKCRKCGKKNHYEVVCKLGHKKKNRKVKKVSDDYDTDDSQSETSDESSDGDSDAEKVTIGKIHDHSKAGGHVLADLDLKIGNKWQSHQCELDTGANTSLVGFDWLTKVTGNPNPKLNPSKFNLQSFGGGEIPVKGEVTIPCRRNGRKYNLLLQVVDVSHRPLLSANVCKILGFVQFCNSVSFTSPQSDQDLLNIYRIRAQAIIDQHPKVFDGYGRFSGCVSLEIDPNVPPTIQQPRRIPIALRPKLKKELKKLEKDGIIVKETSPTDWVSNIVLVKRGSAENESLRICLDPIPLNRALKRPHLQFTTIDEILPELGRAKVFSTVDARKGFWHVVLEEKSSKLTTFWTPFGRYRWVRLPFGIAPAPEIFQMKLQEVVQDIEGVECLVDDLIVFGVGDTLLEALENHSKSLKNLLICLEAKNVKLNRDKLNLCQTSVKFFGHILSDQGLQPDKSKLAAIENFPPPTDRKQLQRFIGMVNYLARFIPNLSANFTNLRRLISDKIPWIWSSVEKDEFERIKSMVANTGTLRYYNVNEPLIIECDASSYGLGVAVFQSKGVVGYASRTLTATEKNYAQIEKELLSILFACVRFDQLIVGNPKTIVRTDHKPLINVFKKPLLSAPRRLQHMLLNLQRYSLQIEFVTGKDNVVADAISRAPFDDEQPEDRFDKRCIYKILKTVEQVNLSSFLSITDERLTEIIKETAVDDSLQNIINYIHHGWPTSVSKVPDSTKPYFKYRNELSTQDGLVFRNERIVIPFKLRRKLAQKVHVSHNGVEATLQLARANIFWPGMSTQLKELVSQCNICAKFAPCQPPPPMQSHQIPVYPFQSISMDVFFAEYQGRKRNFLITVDHYSDFFEVDLLKDLSAVTTIEACKANFSRHGKPQLIVSDNGTNFSGTDWRQFIKTWDIQHSTSAPHHQQANGKAESAVKIAKRLLKKANESNEDFWYALLHWRNVPNKIGSSPAERMFARNTRCGIPTAIENLLPRPIEGVPVAIENNRRRSKLYYDRKTRDLPGFEAGSPVYVQLQPGTSKQWTPAVVENKLNERSYIVDVEGMNYRRDLRHLKPRKEQPKPSMLETQPTQRYTNTEFSAMDDEAERDTTEAAKHSTVEIPVVCGTPPRSSLQSTEATKVSKEPSVQKKTSDRPKRNVKIPVRLQDYEL